MSRKSKPYSVEQLELALTKVRSGKISGQEATRLYGIPNSTLRHKLKGKSKVGAPRGPTPYLSHEEEGMIRHWLINMANVGYPFKRSVLEDTVQKIVLDDGRDTPFKNGKPGKGWFHAFMKRHPVLSEKFSENVSSGSAAVTEVQIWGWFAKLNEYLTSQGCAIIMETPSRIFSAAKCGFPFNKSSGRYFDVGEVELQCLASTTEKDNVSVLGNFSAAGLSVPPLLVFTYQRLPASIKKAFPQDWNYVVTESDGINGQAFLKYLKIFLAWLIAKDIERPVILFIDGQHFDLTLDVSTYSRNNGIIIYCLLPKAMHILQPAEVGIFGRLKFKWDALIQYQYNSGAAVTKSSFASLLQKVWDEAVTPEMIVKAFERCRLFPLNPDRCSSSSAETLAMIELEDSTVTSTDAKVALRVVESVMEPYLLDMFRSSLLENKPWEEEHGLAGLALYNVWKTLKSRESLEEGTRVVPEPHNFEVIPFYEVCVEPDSEVGENLL